MHESDSTEHTDQNVHQKQKHITDPRPSEIIIHFIMKSLSVYRISYLSGTYLPPILKYLEQINTHWNPMVNC